jgi:hypothetical protein
MTTTGNRSVLKLGRPSSIADSEANLERVSAAAPDTDLLLATNLSGRSFAGTAALSQLIITWARRCPQGRLRVHAQGGDEKETLAVLERFLTTDHGMLAATLAGGVFTRRGEGDLSSLVEPILRSRFSRMDDAETSLRGAKTFAMCLDESDFEAPRTLYRARPVGLNREPELRGIEDFQNLALRIQDRLNEGGGDGYLASTASLSRILFELFRNTHDWARYDASERPYAPGSSARGLRVERHNVDARAEKELIGPQAPLRDFFAHPRLTPERGRQRFAELTVFDSGPGVASRRMAASNPEIEAPDIAAEHTALRECLRKHISSSAAEAKGIGLHQVLKDLTALSGFLWLRSGRLSMYRDFLAMPYRPDQTEDEPFLLDWTAGIGGVTESAPVAGSFFTALLPIGNDPNQTTL